MSLCDSGVPTQLAEAQYQLKAMHTEVEMQQLE